MARSGAAQCAGVKPTSSTLAATDPSRPDTTSLARVLLIHPIDATFIRADLAYLRTFAEVAVLHFRGARDYLRLVKAVFRAEVVYCWFALEFAAAAVVFAGLEEIGYGNLLRRRGRLVARIACGTANLVLAFSDWSAGQVKRIAPGAEVRRMYLGVDPDAFRPRPKEDLVVCVAHVSRQNVARKGLRTFLRAASMVPEGRFFLVGRWWDETSDELRAIAPPNATLTGWLPDADLRDLLSRAKVYCQVSYTEGFGLALAEAMACGCVPVVCREGSMPEVVGDTGLYVPYGNEQSLASAIREALRSGNGSDSRDRVLRLFSSDARLRELRLAIQEVQGGAVTMRGSPVRAQRGLVHR
jgi:glycosyltransferase involved in cell wall biosynthesis